MITKRGPTWVVTLKNGEEIICISEEVARQQLAPYEDTTQWEVWTPPDLSLLPLPEVREYDSMEEAIAEED
jgi:hypothetical protein